MVRPKKPAEERARRNYADVGLVVVDDTADLVHLVPEPAKRLLAPTHKAWVTFWQSPLARLVQEADRPALDRLFELYDVRTRAQRQLDKSYLVTGSQGQQVLNPLQKVIEHADREIRALEDRFGLSPNARLRLGVRFVQGQNELDKLNKALANAEDTAEAEDYDPRIVDTKAVER
jgi:P27 family predicted phage terminase small subunit